MGINTRLFDGKRVFVTGHTGFKGSWLSYWLIKMGAEVKGFAKPPETTPNLFGELGLDQLIHSVIGDINDLELLKKEVTEFEPDYILHLAAQPIVRKSYLDPLETYNTNVIGTANILETARQLDKPLAISIITTDKVYQNHEWVHPYRESDQLGGHDPYSASKAASELVVDSYRKSYFNPNTYNKHGKAVISLRAGNVIGGGDWSEDRIVPDIVRALSNGEKLELRNPQAIRPWQHVMEPLYCYLELTFRLVESVDKYSGAWNIGPSTDSNQSVEDLVISASRYWPGSQYETNSDPNAPHEANTLLLDTSKIRSVIDWFPVLGFEDSVRLTIEWYRKFYKGEHARDLVDHDLEFFNNKIT